MVAALGVLLGGVGLAYGFREFLKRELTDAPPGIGGFALARSVPGTHATLWAVGDGDAGAASRALTDRIAARPFDRLIYLGDVYENGTSDEFADNYAPTFGRFAGRTAPTPGNHDWHNHPSAYDPYWGKALQRKKTASWYAFSAGGWRILSLNSETDHGRGSPQERWLHAQLRRRGTCRIAFWHRARYSAGQHGDQPDMAPIWKALRGRARIVLNGHDHDMQRMRTVDGITEFVSGAGGHGHYAVHRGDHRLAFADDKRDGALRLTLRPGRARYTFVAASGRVLDSGAVRCRR
jgi:calcineurin-like phosphoesterase family protein